MQKKPDLALFFRMPNHNLRSFLHRNLTGNEADYRPPFWKGQSRKSVADGWLEVLQNSKIPGNFPTLFGMELDNMDKIGPMSNMFPLKDRIQDVQNYFTRPPSVNFSSEALSRTIDTFKPVKGLRLRSARKTVDDMKLSTNSGAPFFVRKSTVVDETLDMPFLPEEQIAILGWRGQLGGPDLKDVKQRVVWMYPFKLNIEELRFYQPFIRACQQTKVLPPYISNEEVELSITRLFDTKDKDDVVIVTDYTAFDQHFSDEMIDFARQVYSRLLSTNHEWLESVYPLKYNIPIILSEDLMFDGPHGMGSGSGGTNADETVVNIGMQHEAAVRAGKVRNPNSMALGDDGIISFPGIKLQDIIDTYESLGQEMNEEKQFVSTHETQFLQRYYNSEYRDNTGKIVGIYPTMRALSRLLAQERFYDPDKWGPKMVTLRAWSIIENANNHPLFEQFVDYVIKGDKYSLGIDIPGFIENVNKIAREAVGLLPDFLGYTAQLRDPNTTTDLTSWRVYRYLSEKKYS